MPNSASNLANTIDRDGVALVPGILSDAQIEALRNLADAGHALRRGQSAYGSRNLLDLEEVRKLAAESAISALVEPIIGPVAIPVRALFFDKTPEANWPVLWHQDLTIAVADRHELAGWGPWSVKAGVPHVEPPVSLLERMLTVRLHLDDCGPDNGPLRVIPGSHANGRLSRERIVSLRQENPDRTCAAPLGSALLMRPLLLHASSPAKAPSHRRVLHIEFAQADILPAPLAWAATRGARCAELSRKTDTP